MSLRYFANAPATTLAAGCTAVDTIITVASVTGLPIQYPFTLILDRGVATEEAVSVTGASGTDLTVSRGIDGTTAFAHSLGAAVEHGITAQDIREPNTHVNDTANVHGVTGDVVGTSDAQTLSGKTIALGDNTITGTLAQFNTAVTDAELATTLTAQVLTNKDLTDATNTFPSTLATDVEVAAVQTQVDDHESRLDVIEANDGLVSLVGAGSSITPADSTSTALPFGAISTNNADISVASNVLTFNDAGVYIVRITVASDNTASYRLDTTLTSNMPLLQGYVDRSSQGFGYAGAGLKTRPLTLFGVATAGGTITVTVLSRASDSDPLSGINMTECVVMRLF